MVASQKGGGKSGLQRAGCHLTGGRRKATDRATETRQPMVRLKRTQAKVKPWGKSPRLCRATCRVATPTRSKAKQGRDGSGPLLSASGG